MALENAGFEMRDIVHHLFGSGFPKNLDIGKALDKAAGVEREVVGKSLHGSGPCLTKINNHGPGDTGIGYMDGSGKEFDLTAPATDLARQWEGWGTALKPAVECWWLCRKPLDGTVANNIVKHGCGGINIGGCRIEVDPEIDDPRLGGQGTWASDKMAKNVYEGGYTGERVGSDPAGRWPANLITDGSPEVLAGFPKETSQTGNRRNKNRVQQEAQATPFTRGQEAPEYTDGGSPARFFYCAKASPEERNLGCTGLENRKGQYRPNDPDENSIRTRLHGSRPGKNNHPTVKPLALMCYLVRLITPPSGVVLDPFMGSGTTLIAAAKEGFDSVGIDLEAENCEISRRRCVGHLGMLTTVEVMQ
jgi:site-specific DNA-methyltransferase (adenine-specific)